MASCDDPECVQAFQRLQAARNLVLSLCELITQMRASQDQHRALAALFEVTAMSLVGVIIALAVLLPFPFNVIFGGAVGVMLVGFLVAIAFQLSEIARLQQQIDQALQDIAAARATFDNAVAEIIATCDPPCWAEVDLDQPACAAATGDASTGPEESRSVFSPATN